MSSLSRIFMVLGILLGVVVIIWGVQLRNQVKKLEADIVHEKDTAKKLKASQVAEQEEREAKTAMLKTTTQKLEMAKVNIQQDQTQIQEQVQKIQIVEGKVEDTQKELGDVQGRLDVVMKALPGDLKYDQVAPTIEELMKNVKASEQEKTLLRTQIERIDRQRTEMDSHLKKRPHAVPSDLEGRVMSVNAPWNLVVLDIGKRDGLVENAAMQILREGQEISRVLVTSVENTTAIAEIVPAPGSVEIKRGDVAIPWFPAGKNEAPKQSAGASSH